MLLPYLHHLYRQERINMSQQEINNTASIFFNRAAKFSKDSFAAQRDNKGNWHYHTWQETEDYVIKLAKSLKAVGLKQGERVIIAAENRYEWAVLYFAITSAGGIMVPVYTTNNEASHLHVIEDSGARFAFVSTRKLFEKFAPAAMESQRISKIIALENIELKQSVEIDYCSMEKFLEVGIDNDFDPKQYADTIKTTDIACLIYTSGTGGSPKGVMLEHRAILHNVRNIYMWLDGNIANANYLSILPLSHSFEFTIGLIAPTYYNITIHYFSGLENLQKCLQEVKPFFFLAVPRIYEMFQKRIIDEMAKASPIQQKIFNRAIALGMKEYLKQPLSLMEKFQLWSLKPLVQKKIAKKFGDIKIAVSGGAPLDPKMNEWLCAAGLHILQGYGQTESAPVIAANPLDNIKPNTVGVPLAEQEIKIAKDGELLVRGENVMRGYWNNDKATAETLIDGWLHTGDLVEFDEDEHIIITGRKKDIIVLAGGDNISPARIESLLTLRSRIAQAVIYGDKQNFLSAMIVPDEDYILRWAKANNVEPKLEILHENDDFKKDIMKSVDAVSKNLPALEKVKKIIIAPETFTVDNGFLTPTLKVRRQVITQHYQELFENLYKK